MVPSFIFTNSIGELHRLSHAWITPACNILVTSSSMITFLPGATLHGGIQIGLVEPVSM